MLRDRDWIRFDECLGFVFPSTVSNLKKRRYFWLGGYYYTGRALCA